jgi:hypothetical protein
MKALNENEYKKTGELLTPTEAPARVGLIHAYQFNSAGHLKWQKKIIIILTTTMYMLWSNGCHTLRSTPTKAQISHHFTNTVFEKPNESSVRGKLEIPSKSYNNNVQTMTKQNSTAIHHEVSTPNDFDSALFQKNPILARSNMPLLRTPPLKQRCDSSIRVLWLAYLFLIAFVILLYLLVICIDCHHNTFRWTLTACATIVLPLFVCLNITYGSGQNWWMRIWWEPLNITAAFVMTSILIGLAWYPKKTIKSISQIH